MVGIIDFRKSGGQKIPDIVQYVKDYVQTHSNIEVVVTTDSQNKAHKTVFCTAVIMYDMGDGEHGHGAHCIYRKWDVPIYGEERELERLRQEVTESIQVAQQLRDNGVNVDLVDIDINPESGDKDQNKSYQIFAEAKASVEWAGFNCTWKGYGNCFASFPDKIVKRS